MNDEIFEGIGFLRSIENILDQGEKEERSRICGEDQ